MNDYVTSHRAILRSLLLGWLVQDILAGREVTPYPSDLKLDAKAGYVAQAIHLKTLLAPLKLDDSANPKAVIDKLTAGSAAKEEAEGWQHTLAGALAGADLRFATAYGVGRHLNMLADGQVSPDTFGQPLVTETIWALDDLSTALPAHAARGAVNSIGRWKASDPFPGQDTWAAQVVLWRTILTGEKKGTELLEPENYLDAAERLAVKLRATATSVLKQYTVWVVLIAVLFVAGICALFLAPRHAGTTAAGLSGVIAALGLTWKGVGGALGKLTAKLEAPLWGAELGRRRHRRDHAGCTPDRRVAGRRVGPNSPK